MENPFEIILERLDRIEKTIEQLSANGPSANYKFTSEGSIPHYKNGKRLYFKRDEINEWIFSTKVNTGYDIDRAANEYIRKHPRKY